MSDDLEPMTPCEGVEMYLDHRRGSLHERTIQSHHYRLKQFVEWLDDEGITNLNDLSGRTVERFFQYRRKSGISETTIRGNSYTYRAYLQYCEAIEAVPDGLGEKVLIPELDKHQLSRNHDLRPERIQSILEHYRQFEYASRHHVILELLFHIGCRIGALHAVDLRDYHPDEQYLEFVHREPETPLKNDVNGERPIALSEDVVEIVEDYRQVNRHDVTDDDGREPLITSRYGRMTVSAMRDIVYRMTRPCGYGECPHDRDPESCEAMEPGLGSRCPSSRAPHDVRSAAIMHMRSLDIPARVVSKRVNATQEVIEDYYDERTPRERMEQRRQTLEVLQ
ncbi:integrase [Salinigranum rubrum]|uniref:Integrase n=1 Tax=Salinigranum rubrum TaxID=755307 RepID=A0A2I8VJI3_9EURY|nr:site-specific integrase [Salinigranum rubrum]AUV82080.1 integrase [Salinigranum rubrum]